VAVRTGVMSSATPGKAIYDLIAADLAANPNWSRPAVSSLTGATNSHGANWTSQIWKCTVGAQVFHVIFSYDVTTTPLALYIQSAEAYDGSDGGGSPVASKFRRHGGAGALTTTGDGTAVTPGATDVANSGDVFLNSTNPNFAITNVLGSGSAFSYLFKVGNKAITIAYSVGGVNRWCHVGAFESLVTGPPDPMPLGQFSHPLNNPTPKDTVISTANHGEGVVSRNPGLGTGTEEGAFFANLNALHAPITNIHYTPGAASADATGPSMRSYGASVPRWYTKVLMSQAVIHQSAEGHSNLLTKPQQTFRGYYPDLFAGIMGGVTEPTGGGVDSVVIDGVTYYWLGLNCIGAGIAIVTTNTGTLIALRAD